MNEWHDITELPPASSKTYVVVLKNRVSGTKRSGKAYLDGDYCWSGIPQNCDVIAWKKIGGTDVSK